VTGETWTWRTTLAAGLIGACVCLSLAFSLQERGGDFSEFYAAGKLAGSGQLYDWARVREIEHRFGVVEIPFGRLPFYAVVFKPLAAMPYQWARTIWLLLNAAALLAFARLWPVERRDHLALSVCWCLPAAMLLSTGQDTAMFLLFATLGLRLIEANREFAAGLVLSLCAAKFHLAAGILVFLLAQRRGRAVLAGALGGVAQLAVSFAAEGKDWPAILGRLSAIPEFSPAAAKMPNLLGLTHWLPHGLLVEAALALLALWAVWVISARSEPVVGAAVALLGGLLAGHHSYAYDAILLLPAVALTHQLSIPGALRYWAMLLATPLPYLLLIKDRLAMAGQVSISVFCLALLGYLAAICLGWSSRQASLRRAKSNPIPSSPVICA